MSSNFSVAFLQIMCLMILVFVIDLSINMRRLLASLDRVWRKLSEINDTLLKK